jgi:hypothetical protein
MARRAGDGRVMRDAVDAEGRGEEFCMAAKKPAKNVAKATVKRPGAKRAAGGASARKAAGTAASPQRVRLKTMLSEAIEQIDEEGLLFLLRQANVLIHNQKVDEVNRELAELSEKPGRAAMGRSAAGGRAAAVVSIEDSGDRSAIFLTLGNVRKVLNLEELKRLVRICYAAESKTDALQQLYRVLAQERSDILKDAGIRSAANPILEGLFYALRRKYHLEDR